MKGDLWKTRLLEEVDITKPPYTDRYPELAGFMETTPHQRINHVKNNVVLRCDDFVQGIWEANGNWLTSEDPGFKDEAGGNYEFLPDAPVFQRIRGFEAIPFARIGRNRALGE